MKIFDPIVPALHSLASCRFITSEYLTTTVREKRSWKKRLFSRPWKPFKKFSYKEVPDRNVYIIHKCIINIEDGYGIGDWFICHPTILEEALRHVTILNSIEMDSETTEVLRGEPPRIQEFMFSRRYAKYEGKELNMEFIRERIKDISDQLAISEETLTGIYYKAQQITFNEENEENKDKEDLICCAEFPFVPLSEEEKEALKKKKDTIPEKIAKLLDPDATSEDDLL